MSEPVVPTAAGVGAGYAAVAHAISEGLADAGWLDDFVSHIEAREDLADHRLMVVLALLLDGAEVLPSSLRAGLEQAVLGFRFWMDEPGEDSMCHWAESHQVAFGACEYLAGRMFPDQVFANDGRRGSQKAERARARLVRWLGNRFRHGFSEWLSGTFYAVDVAALTLLVEHAGDDEELVTRATMVLDLIMLDLAMHRFEGHFVASAGRVLATHKAHPEHNEIEPVVQSAFGRTKPDFDPELFTSIFLARRRYRVPQVVREIAFEQADHLITSSHGLNLREVTTEVGRNRQLSAEERRDAALELYWSMEAFTTPEAIGATMDGYTRLQLEANHYLSPLAPFRKVKSRRVLAGLVRSLNPTTQGTALQRAEVQTYRTPHYLLSSAQHHQPGSFGDQESIWAAALPGGIKVFSTHPGSTLLDAGSRPATPSGWVGNGIRPDVGQLRNVLLVLHDLRARRGYLEGRRHELSHLYFPAARFDETTLGSRVVAGRRDDSYFGAVSLNPIEMTNEHELVQRGLVTGWAVMVADRSDFGSLHRFVDYLKDCELVFNRETLGWTTPQRRYELTWNGPFCVDGVVLDTEYARLRSDWTSVARKPSVIEVSGRTGTLVLDWKMCRRSQGPARPR